MPVERVSFEVEGDTVVGDLHLPAGEGPHRAVVVGGPMTSVKEQVTGVYARALARRGFAALAIDPRHFGESGGAPRQYEHCGRKIADYRAALRFLERHPAIDGARLGAVGVCLGAGYAAWAAADAPQVRAFAGVAGYYRDVQDLRAADPAGFQARVDAGVRAREHYEATGEVLTIPAVALAGDAAMTSAETYDYYGTPRAAVANYRNAFAVMSREHFLTFDVQAAAPRLTAPVLLVHSERALSPAWARRFFAGVQAPKELRWIESRGQVDLYDDPERVDCAADLVAAHLEAHLGASGQPSAGGASPSPR